MPHVNIKHFPVPLDAEREATLVRRLTEAVTEAFGCGADAVSIAREPVEADRWEEQVLRPEIDGRRELLIKTPNY